MADTKLPVGAEILTSPSQIPQYNIQGQVGETNAPGSYLYGTPKAVAPVAPSTAPASTIPVVSADKAITDLAVKKNTLDTTNQQMTDQAQLNAATKAQTDTAAALKAQQDTQNAQKQQEIDAKAQLGKDIGSITGNAEDTTFQAGKADVNKQLDDAYAGYKSQVDSLQNGTFPLSPADQAKIAQVSQKFEQLKQAQMLANKNYEGGITQLGIASGRARYAPEMELGNIQKAVNLGLSKIADIEARAAEAVTNLQEAFQERDYKRINDAYLTLNENLKRKSTALSDLQKDINDEAAAQQQKIKNAMDMQTFENQQYEFNVKQEERTGNYLASNLVGVDQNFNAVEPTQEEIAQFAEQAGIDPMVLAGLVNKRIEEVNKLGMDDKKFLYQQQQDVAKQAFDEKKFNYQQLTDSRDFDFEREKFTADQYDKQFNRALKLEELKAKDNFGLSGQQVSDAIKKGYVTEPQLKLYKQQIDSGEKPAVLKEKSPEARKLESNMISGISAIDLISKKVESDLGRGKFFDGEYKNAESNLLEIISNLKTGAAYTDDQLEHFQDLLPKFWQTDDTRQKNLEKLKNEFIQVLGTDTYKEIKKEQYADAQTFNQFGTIKEHDDFAKYLNEVGANPNEDINEYFDIYKQKKGFSTEGSDSDQRSSLDSLKQSLITQESGGDYGAIGIPTDYGKALGKYQIIPKFHFGKIGLDPSSEEDKKKFLSSPDLQDKLFEKIIDGLASTYKNDPKKIAAAYYGGGGGVAKLGTSAADVRHQGGKAPSINEYVNQVLSRLS